MLLQQTVKFLIDIFKMKVKGKINKTSTCDWIKMDPVEGEKCTFESEEDFLTPQNLIAMFEFRANLLLQRTGWELSSKL